MLLLQCTEDGEPPLPEEGDEADVDVLDYTDPSFQYGGFSV